MTNSFQGMNCKFDLLHGKLNSRVRELRSDLTDVRESSLCKYFLNGCCTRGENCRYSHDVSSSPEHYKGKGKGKGTPPKNNIFDSPITTSNTSWRASSAIFSDSSGGNSATGGGLSGLLMGGTAVASPILDRHTDNTATGKTTAKAAESSAFGVTTPSTDGPGSPENAGKASFSAPWASPTQLSTLPPMSSIRGSNSEASPVKRNLFASNRY